MEEGFVLKGDLDVEKARGFISYDLTNQATYRMHLIVLPKENLRLNDQNQDSSNLVRRTQNFRTTAQVVIISQEVSTHIRFPI